MIQVESVEDAAGKWINDYVQLLTAPRFEHSTGMWTALANAYGTLAIVEVTVNRGESHGT